MGGKGIQTTRIQHLNQKHPGTGDFVIYWMQQSQRAEYNHALEYALHAANEMNQPLLVVFALMADYPEANARHYTFMLEGLRETQRRLASRGIKLLIRRGHPPQVVSSLASRASIIVCDCGYLRHQRNWRRETARRSPCRVVQVESDVIVPVGVASNKAEYAARTFRPKVHKHLADYLTPVRPGQATQSSLDVPIDGLDIQNIPEMLSALGVDTRIPAVSRFFKGGADEARRRFRAFLNHGLVNYMDHGNQPQTDDISHMSPYLHFGQISSLDMALQVSAAAQHRSAKDAFMEQLVVRRELAMNFVHYTPEYDAYGCLPLWARKTLNQHGADKRDTLYPPETLEKAETHDPYWNAAMQEMRATGFMHNYMRMYWGKKILEWSPSPQSAFIAALRLNNTYFLDGRDPNSYAGVSWIFGLHDRAWKERPVFGKIRYMAASGLERKCDIRAYVKKAADLVRKAAL